MSITLNDLPADIFLNIWFHLDPVSSEFLSQTNQAIRKLFLSEDRKQALLFHHFNCAPNLTDRVGIQYQRLFLSRAPSAEALHERALEIPHKMAHSNLEKFSVDGTRMLKVNRDGRVELWDLSIGECLKELSDSRISKINDMHLSPEGTRAILGSIQEGGLFEFWDLTSGACTKTLSLNSPFIKSTCNENLLERFKIAADGTQLFFRCILNPKDDIWEDDDALLRSQKHIEIWDLITGNPSPIPEDLSKDLCCDFKMSADGTKYLGFKYLESDGNLTHFAKIKFWDILKGTSVDLPGDLELDSVADEPTIVLTMTPDGTKAVAQSGKSALKFWDLTTNQCLQTLIGFEEPSSSRVFFEEGSALCHEDCRTGTIINSKGTRLLTLFAYEELRILEAKLWNLQTGECLKAFPICKDFSIAQNAEPIVIKMSADGLIAYEYRKNHLRLWDLSRGSLLSGACFPDGGKNHSLHVAGDGTRAISISIDESHAVNQSLRVWNIAPLPHERICAIVFGYLNRDTPSDEDIIEDALQRLPQPLKSLYHEDTPIENKVRSLIPKLQAEHLPDPKKMREAALLVEDKAQEYTQKSQLRSFMTSDRKKLLFFPEAGLKNFHIQKSIIFNEIARHIEGTQKVQGSKKRLAEDSPKTENTVSPKRPKKSGE